MTGIGKFALLLMAGAAAAQAQLVCDVAKLQGTYGFLLTGQTTISGDSKPVASAGRLTFDGHGAISGQASVNFAGYLLGNPVTGSYEATAACTVTWQLQDDSGGYQHFSGTFQTDWSRADFRQTDAGAAQTGKLALIAPQCSATALAPAYSFSITGSTTPMKAGDSGAAVHSAGRLTHAEDGSLLVTVDSLPPTGLNLHIDSDCVVETSLPLPGGPVSLRGTLVDGGREIWAIDTDAGAAVTAKFTIFNVPR